MAAAARPRDEAAAFGSGFLPAQPASHRSRDQWAARTGVRPGRGLRDPAPRTAGGGGALPSRLGTGRAGDPRPTQGRPFQPSPAWGSQCKARERSDGKGGGRGLAEAASASPRFAAPNWLPSPGCHDAAAQLRALKARGCSQFPA